MNGHVDKIMTVLSRAGHQAFLVGGSVRDMIMGEKPHDYDITTSALPQQVIQLFDKVVPTGIDFGTVTVMLDGAGYEVTTMRGDGRYTDGRRPESVSFVQDIEVDLARRDFTMNAMAMDQSGKVIDPFRGRYDIAARRVRAVGVPDQRFHEDGLRVMRAIRFATRFAFDIEPATKGAVIRNAHLVANVSRERVRDELVKILVFSWASRVAYGLRLLADLGLLPYVLPEAVDMVGCQQNHYHDFDVWEHTIRVVAGIPDGSTTLRLAALFHDIGKPSVKQFDEKRGEHGFYGHADASVGLCRLAMGNLKFSNADIEAVCNLVELHMFELGGTVKDSTIRRFLRKVMDLNGFLTLRRADILGTRANVNEARDDLDATNLLEARCKALAASTPAKGSALPVTGHDVMALLNCGPGPTVGQVLRGLMDHVLEHPEDNNRDALLERIRSEHGIL